MWKVKLGGIIAISTITTAVVVSTAVLAASDAVEEAVDISSAALAFTAIVSLAKGGKDDKDIENT